MATVREATLDLLRSLGMTTVFGNPGSTEIPFLNDFPEDFTYVLGLQEASVLGMADGYAQGTGGPALVNLHTAPGLGNSLGNLVSAWHNKAPLVVTAGQQDRRHVAKEPLLTGKLVDLARPYVKRAVEPLRAEDVPGEILRAYHTASQPPQGPVFVSIPMDDWDREATEELHPEREVVGAPSPDPAALDRVTEALRSAESPAIVAGSGVDRSGAFYEAAELAERARAAVWTDPISGRAGFPQDHPLYRGQLAPAQAQLAKQLSGHDVVLVLGAPVFLYYPYVPGPTLEEGTRLFHVTEDPQEAARATLGTSIVGDVGAAVRHLAGRLPEGERLAKNSPPETPEKGDPMSVAYAMHALGEALPPEAVIVDESISSNPQLKRYVTAKSPGGYYTSAAGGLGWAMPAAVGLKLASPERPVVCAIGDGSAMYSVQALWSAVRYGAPVVFYVIDNSGYSILKGFRDALGAEGVPGLDLPGVDAVRVAEGLGCAGENVSGADGLPGAIRRALVSGEPYLLNVAVDPTPPPLLGG
ncbi:benzoylformate decarboxylase [Rubrobacter aplysinae]|uniref:benzoylformate decarboxylase n=1 Tax=Rubrobacter aplysinae TaxID=909625 RepID=UPI00064BFE2B|nr:benzoylformate decarboxylase [Rubrobacter aplysinae]